MARRQSEANGARRSLWVLLFVVFVFCSVAYIGLSAAMRPRRGDSTSSVVDSARGAKEEEEEKEEVGECCRGIEGLELWGAAVKWGSDHRFDSAGECCRACEAMCPAASSDRPCLCDSWVFCGDRALCGDRFGECWLKKQDDVLFPAVAATGEDVMWTSGLIFGEGETREHFMSNFSLPVRHVLSLIFLSSCNHAIVLVAKFIVPKIEEILGIPMVFTLQMLLLVLRMHCSKEHLKPKGSHSRTYL